MFTNVVVNENVIRSIERSLKDVDDDTLWQLIQTLVKPFLRKASRHRYSVAAGCVLGMSFWCAYRPLKKKLLHWMVEVQFVRKTYLSCVAAQLLTTQINQPFARSKRWVDKRMLFQKDLQSISILNEKLTKIMIVKAASRTTPQDHFVTSNLSEGDRWRVLNSLANELSTMAGVSHMCALGGMEQQARADWYIIALMNPKYSGHQDPHGGICVKLRLVVIWEKELWEIVCNMIQRAKQGMLTQRHERRWGVMTSIALKYKQVMGKTVLRAAHKAMKGMRRQSSPVGAQEASGSPVMARQSTLNRLSSAVQMTRYWTFDAEEDMTNVEVSKAQFLEFAKLREIPERAATAMFTDFDLNRDGMVSLAEIDMSCADPHSMVKTCNQHVEDHLYRVSLPTSHGETLGGIGMGMGQVHQEESFVDMQAVRSMLD